MASKPVDKILPKKEKDLYKIVVESYDKKEYAQGEKAADQILAKFPNHGETLAMKGLLVHTLGNKEKGYELAKLGLRNDIRCGTCWHVLGLMHRADDNYKEATKFFLNAARIEPNNQNILRDLSWLQIQLRDMPGFLESRRKSIVLRPGMRANWVGYIVASYFAEKYEDTISLIDQLKAAWAEGQDVYEESELLMFQNRCFEKQGLYTEALEHLDKFGIQIVDKLSLKTKRAELYTRTKQWDQAMSLWIENTEEQPDNYRFHCGLQTCALQIEDTTLLDELFALKRLDLPSSILELTEEQKQTILNVYEKDYTFCTSTASKRIALTLLSGAAFETKLDQYLRKRISSAVPSLYSDIVSLVTKTVSTPNGESRRVIVSDVTNFKEHSIVQLTMKLVRGYIASLKKCDRFSEESSGEVEQPPSSLLWALFLLCHFEEKCGNPEAALELINECIFHTPTAPDMYMKKAKVLKKLGDFSAAAKVADFGRSLDLQDRFLNNRTTKYLLRDDQIYEAMTTISMFTKHEGDPQKVLADLQCAWYALELGESCERVGNFGLGLKKFHSCQANFISHHADMFDFHYYCIRKSAVRAYTEMLRMLDGLYNHKTYERAARGAIRIYLRMHAGEKPSQVAFENPKFGKDGELIKPADPSETSEVVPETEPPVLENSSEAVDVSKELTAAEKKKLKKKMKKVQKKKAEAEDEPEPPAEEEVDNDKDPQGASYLETEDPLGEAVKWCNNLSRHSTLEPATQALVSEVYLLKGKFLPSLRALVCGFDMVARKYDVHYHVKIHHDLLVALTKFCLTVAESMDSMSDVVRETINTELSILMHDQGIVAYINDLIRNIGSQVDSPFALDYRMALLKCVKLCNAETGDAAAIIEKYPFWSTLSAKACIRASKVCLNVVVFV